MHRFQTLCIIAMYYRSVLLMYYRSWKFDWKFMWIIHYLSILIQNSVLVPPEGMVIMKMPDRDVCFMSYL